jgi:dTDP-4-amino-4,6-dideoxygalactose transaminase
MPVGGRHAGTIPASPRQFAVLGGNALFAPGVPFVRPAVPPIERVMRRLQPSYDRGALTNGPLVRQLEEATARVLGVRHVVAVSSCTSGLLLVVQAVARGVPVVLPSFTFCATAHAVAWNGSRPVFAECDEATFQVDVSDVARRMDGCGAILATHVFGAPCPVEELEALALEWDVPLVFDAAHAFGAMRRGRAIGGFGKAEVFSLTPTKPFVAGEGGLVATDDASLAETIRLGRDYGNPGDYDTVFAGLNARMSEMHAAIALESLDDLPANLGRRRAVAATYSEELEGVPGVGTQVVEPGDESTWKDFTITLDERVFGLTRDEVARALAAEGVDTRSYFCPPVHRQKAYAQFNLTDLPVTDRLAGQVLSLPIFPSLSRQTVATICGLIADLHRHATTIRPALERG